MRSFIQNKNKKLKINNVLVQKYKNMLENSDFEQNYRSRTATGIYKKEKIVFD